MSAENLPSLPGPIVRAIALTKIYQPLGGRETVTALDHLDLEIAAGERVAIIGATGCGKSTFFRLVCGLERPTSGQIIVEGRSPSAQFDWFRGRLGVVFQEDRLLPWRTALQNVMLGLEFLRPVPHDREERARTWLERLGLGHAIHSYPGELSGGMRQRVAIARAFAPAPHILLADEAFSQLDAVTSRTLRTDFLALCMKQQTTLLMVTHRLEEALEMADRVVVFGRSGRVVEEVRLSGVLPEADRRPLRAQLERALHSTSSKGDCG